MTYIVGAVTVVHEGRGGYVEVDGKSHAVEDEAQIWRALHVDGITLLNRAERVAKDDRVLGARGGILYFEELVEPWRRLDTERTEEVATRAPGERVDASRRIALGEGEHERRERDLLAIHR